MKPIELGLLVRMSLTPSVALTPTSRGERNAAKTLKKSGLINHASGTGRSGPLMITLAGENLVASLVTFMTPANVRICPLCPGLLVTDKHQHPTVNLDKVHEILAAIISQNMAPGPVDFGTDLATWQSYNIEDGEEE